MLKGIKKIIKVADNQRVLMFKNQQLVDVLTTGKYQFWDIKNELDFTSFELSDFIFSAPNAERLLKLYPILAQHLEQWQLSENEVGLFYANGLLHGVVAPGEQMILWRDAADFRVEKVSLDENIAVNESLLRAINRAGANQANRLIRSEHNKATQPIAEFQVAQDHIGLLYINGQLMNQLAAGRYGFWQFNHNVELKTYDCRAQLLDISGQEILSKDRVSLRINLSASIKINDVERAASSVENVNDFIYKTLQLALREAVGIQSLDDILLDKLYINETVKALVTTQLNEIGVSLLSVGVKDIILPGEMKAILNQVVEAQKAAEANVIKRREETSATRSLHNTAKVMENNPTLLRLKELEALEKVAEKINNLNVYGGIEELMKGTVKLG
ncbi:slipin family protein [Motilimonas cestriensis]|uniref:slipin family protein n=1 Tax=Motilimonas cestriensis TaxID=2742685 RepID=UPI003DA64B91